MCKELHLLFFELFRLGAVYFVTWFSKTELESGRIASVLTWIDDFLTTTIL